MKSVYDFIVKPINGRYNNVKKVGDVDLIVNTRIEEYKSISKVAEVVALPMSIKTDIKVGDIVVIHHNIFRRFYDIRGNEKIVELLLKKICTLALQNRFICTETIYLIWIIVLLSL